MPIKPENRERLPADWGDRWLKSLADIRRTYGVPAKRLGRVRYAGLLGTITGHRGPLLAVRLDGDQRIRLFIPNDHGLYYLATGAQR